MTEKIKRPVKYIRLSNYVLYLLPKCYCSYPDSDAARDCQTCLVTVECREKRPSYLHDS
jgi:hypothetical protein